MKVHRHLVSSVTSVQRDRIGCDVQTYPDSKIHGANMGRTWVLSVPGVLHIGPLNIAIRVC